MDDEHNQEMDESENQPDDPKNADIPPWLQGLDEPDEDDTNPIKAEDRWVKEIPEESLIDRENPANLVNDQNPENDLPDWMNELSQIDDTLPSEHEPTTKSIDVTEDAIGDNEGAFSIEEDGLKELEHSHESSDIYMDTKDAPVNEDALDDMTSEQGFVEISEISLNELPEAELSTSNEKIMEEEDEDGEDGEEELPQWLKEMIIEPSAIDNEEEASEEFEYDNEEEITQPIIITSEDPFTNEPEELLSEEQSLFSPDEIELSEPSDIAETEQAMLSESSENVIDEPVADAFEEQVFEEIEVPTSEEFEELEQFEIPEQLQEAKMLLQDNKYQEATGILKGYLEEPVFLEHIEEWLQDIVESDHDKGAPGDVDIWEMLGDIAIKKEQPGDAFNAYIKAISSLLKNEEAGDEIN